MCYFDKPKRMRVDSEGSWTSEAAAKFFGKESVLLEPIPGQAQWKTGLKEEAIRGLKATMTATALEHQDMGAHGCLARAVAASNAREDVRGYSPLQHALGRAPDLDGRFYTPEYEALHTVQGELVDETYGNNIKWMQDSEVNFLRWTYQNRVSRALNSKNRKAQVFLPGTYVYYWRKDKKETKGSFKGIARLLCTETRRDNEKEGSTGQLPLLPGAPRPGGCVWLSRAGRLMRADPTQLRLASGREEACQKIHDSHPMPWTARGELQKLQKVSTWTSPQIFQKILKIRGRTHLGMCRQIPLTRQHNNSNIHANDFSQKQNPEAAKALKTCLQVPLRRHLRIQNQIGAGVTQSWRVSSRRLANTLSRKPAEMFAFVSSAARKGRKDVFEPQMSLKERKQFDPRKQKEINNYTVNDVLEKLEPHEKPPRESILKMRWVLEDRLDENENKSPKARIVILGYLDPDYENRPAASPTMTRNTRQLLLQFGAWMGVAAAKGDVSGAFLQGRKLQRDLWVLPVRELTAALNVSPGEVMKLTKSSKWTGGTSAFLQY